MKESMNRTYSNERFLLYSSIRGANFFFISSIILSFEFWNIIFAGISKPPCSRDLSEPVISHLIFPVCLTKKCVSFDKNCGRSPTATAIVLINAIAYLSWTKDYRSSSCLADKIEPTGASKMIWKYDTHEQSNSQQKQILLLGKFLFLFVINISLATVLMSSLYTL